MLNGYTFRLYPDTSDSKIFALNPVPKSPIAKRHQRGRMRPIPRRLVALGLFALFLSSCLGATQPHGVKALPRDGTSGIAVGGSETPRPLSLSGSTKGTGRGEATYPWQQQRQSRVWLRSQQDHPGARNSSPERLPEHVPGLRVESSLASRRSLRQHPLNSRMSPKGTAQALEMADFILALQSKAGAIADSPGAATANNDSNMEYALMALGAAYSFTRDARYLTGLTKGIAWLADRENMTSTHWRL